MIVKCGSVSAAWVLVAALVSGCASTTTTKAPAAVAQKDLRAADYYPLEPGWRWAYDLEKDGDKMLAVYSVLERTADTATIQAGDDRLTYAITPEGIAQKDGPTVGDFVLKNPPLMGGEWPVQGGTAKVVAAGQQVTVAAGKFDNCVVVEVTRSDPVRIARTTFAAGVGPIALEFQVQDGGKFVTVTKASLRAVTKPGEDPLGAK
jgi:hypothetical protein